MLRDHLQIFPRVITIILLHYYIHNNKQICIYNNKLRNHNSIISQFTPYIQLDSGKCVQLLDELCVNRKTSDPVHCQWSPIFVNIILLRLILFTVSTLCRIIFCPLVTLTPYPTQPYMSANKISLSSSTSLSPSTM